MKMSMTEGYRSMMMISFVREEEEKKEAMPLIEILKREKKFEQSDISDFICTFRNEKSKERSKHQE